MKQCGNCYSWHKSTIDPHEGKCYHAPNEHLYLPEPCTGFIDKSTKGCECWKPASYKESK